MKQWFNIGRYRVGWNWSGSAEPDEKGPPYLYLERRYGDAQDRDDGDIFQLHLPWLRLYWPHIWVEDKPWTPKRKS